MAVIDEGVADFPRKKNPLAFELSTQLRDFPRLWRIKSRSSQISVHLN